MSGDKGEATCEDETDNNIDEEENEEGLDEGDNEGERSSGAQVGRKPQGPPCSLKTLVNDRILQPENGCLTIEYMV